MALLGWWKCDETSGSTLADSSGNGRTLTLNGTYTVNTTAISSNSDAGNKCVDFGTGYASLAGDTTLRAVTTWTIGAWINWDTLVANCMVMGMARPGTAKINFGLFHNADAMWGVGRFGVAFYDNVAFRTCHYSTALSTGTTYFLAGSYDGTTMKFYVDGALVNTTTPGGTNGASDNSFLVGRFWGADSSRQDGRTDDVFITNTALSDADIAALYADMADLPTLGPQPPVYRLPGALRRQAVMRASSM